MDRQRQDKRVCVARIGAAHGVRGDVKLWSFTADPLAIAEYGPLETEDGRRSFEIERLRPQGEFLVAHLKGVPDRNAAELLRNTDLYVSREKFPEIDESDEFYVADLIGLTACDNSGAPLGEVVGVHNFGAGDLIELRLSGERETLLLPFSDAVVPAVDIAGGKVTVELPHEIPSQEENPLEAPPSLSLPHTGGGNDNG
ncbi:MAG: ribosome maturation factor RimM [Xanthobacteraceae bacterium]